MKKRCPKRDAILEYIRSTDTHPSAEQVYTQLKPRFPDLALGTVYRNLSKFRQDGIIASLGTVKGVERFDHNPLPHAHFVCNQCCAVMDVPGLVCPPELIHQVNHGRVTECVLTFHGLCNQCK